MAFKTRWECEHCGYEISSLNEPEEYECPNYESESHSDSEFISSKPDILSFQERQSKGLIPTKEAKERYRIAYHLRGSTWSGVQSYMYDGDLKEGTELADKAILKKNTKKG